MTKKEITEKLRWLIRNYQGKIDSIDTDGYTLGEKIAYTETKRDLTKLVSKITEDT